MEKVLSGKTINEKKVWSANKCYLVFGVLMLIGAVLLFVAPDYMFYDG